MHNRLKEVRTKLEMNQSDFADSLGIGLSSLGMMEIGKRNILDRHIKVVVSVHNVNEDWLRYGKGDMFVPSDNTIIAELAAEYKLSAIDKEILTHFLQMDEHARKVITDEIVSLANKISSIEDVDPIEEEVNNYRMELEAQKKTAEQSTRYDIGEGEGS